MPRGSRQFVGNCKGPRLPPVKRGCAPIVPERRGRIYVPREVLMRKAMFALALFVLVPATAFAGPFKSERSAKSSPLPQIESLGGNLPTSLCDDELDTRSDSDI